MADSAPGWRLLAHPLRSSIIAHLRVHGGATSAELARALDTHTGATSYHVRVLAGAGLVQDTGLGNAKTRIWALAEPDDLDDLDDLGGLADDESATADRDTQDMDDWLAHDYADHLSTRMHAWVDQRHQWNPVWQDECGPRDTPALVSEEQVTALRAEIDDLLERYRRIGAGTPGARRVAVYTAVLPIEPRRP